MTFQNVDHVEEEGIGNRCYGKSEQYVYMKLLISNVIYNLIFLKRFKYMLKMSLLESVWNNLFILMEFCIFDILMRANLMATSSIFNICKWFFIIFDNLIVGLVKI